MYVWPSTNFVRSVQISYSHFHLVLWSCWFQRSILIGIFPSSLHKPSIASENVFCIRAAHHKNARDREGKSLLTSEPDGVNGQLYPKVDFLPRGKSLWHPLDQFPMPYSENRRDSLGGVTLSRITKKNANIYHPSGIQTCDSLRLSVVP